MINQFMSEIPKKINIGTRVMLIIFMALLMLIIVPLLTSILFEQGLIPNDALTVIFFVLLVPAMGIIALIYVIWKM